MEKETVRTSIFKQKTYANRYVADMYNENKYDRDLRRTIASVKYYLKRISELISDDEIIRCDIELPLLEIDEEFYIEKLDLFVKIASRLRTANGSVVYYITNKYIEDEKTKETYNQATEYIESKNNYIELKNSYNKIIELIPKRKLKHINILKF